MRRIPNSALAAVFAAVIVTLLVLAVLQYRWINEASATEQHRMEESLRTAMIRFREDLQDELTRLASTLSLRDMSSPEQIAQLYSERLQEWTSTSRFPELLKDVLLGRIEGPRSVTLFRYDPKSRTIEPAEWPAGLEAFREHAALESVRVSSPEVFRGPPSREPPVTHLPAIARPIFAGRGSRSDFGDQPAGGLLQGWQIIRLDPDVLKEQVLPELAATHFPSSDHFEYDLLITEARNGAVVFASPPEVRASWFEPEDFILIPMQGMGVPPGLMPRRGGPSRGSRPGQSEFRGGRGMPPPGAPAGSGGGWHLYARYRGGSVESFVGNVRRTNLAVSFGLLVVLAGVIAFTLVYADRVRALGKMQMELAAGLSHELRTPLTAIRSAAYNMIVGNVSNKEDVVKYGRVLHEQGVRLSEIVEQALMFAQTQSGKEQYATVPTDVAAVVNKAIDSFRSLHPEARCDIVTRIHENLLPAMTDAGAVTLCLQNLLANAVKYGMPGKPVTVEARMAPVGTDVAISVADQGPGIHRSDLAHVFEPFFRGRNAGSARGNGLGLYLVKRAMESVKGRVEVESSENGSRFTLFIPSSAGASVS